ncbi:hypothetical protein P8452_46877 [Trifolium repens]|nr:hypothetical protein P8452_46877 [Trifolium repens]
MKETETYSQSSKVLFESSNLFQDQSRSKGMHRSAFLFTFSFFFRVPYIPLYIKLCNNLTFQLLSKEDLINQLCVMVNQKLRKDRGKADSPIYSIQICVPKHALNLIFSFTNGEDWDGLYRLQFQVPKPLKEQAN